MTKHVIVNNKEEDKIKDRFCPACYFEEDKQIMRKDCPHNKNESIKDEFISFCKAYCNKYVSIDRHKDLIKSIDELEEKSYMYDELNK